jgi:hypothetical protein
MTSVYLQEFPLGYPFTLTELMTYGVYFPETEETRKKGVVKDTYVGTVEVVENPNFKEGQFEASGDNIKIDLDDNFEHTSKWSQNGGLKNPSYRLQDGKAHITSHGNANMKLTDYELFKEYFKDGQIKVDSNENFVVPARNKFLNKNGKIEVNVDVKDDEIIPDSKIEVKSKKNENGKDENLNDDEKKIKNLIYTVFDVNDYKKTLGEDDYKPNKKDDETGYSEQIEYKVEIPEDLSTIKNSKHYIKERQTKAKKDINIIVPDVDLEKVKRKQELEKELEKQRSLQAEYVPLKGNYHIRPFLTDIISSKVESEIPKPSYTLIKDESNYETAGDYKLK